LNLNNSFLKSFDEKLESPFIMNPSRFESGAVGGWKELGRTTLGIAGDTIDVSSLPDKRYYMVLGHTISSGNTQQDLRLNGDSANNYAYRVSQDGGADVTGSANRGFLLSGGVSTTTDFGVGYLSNLSTKEKLVIGHAVSQSTAGAGTAPSRGENVTKWVNTTDVINAIQSFNAQSGNFASGSEVVVLGWDTADIHTTNFWEELASADLSGGASDTLSSGTFTSKKYLWVQYYLKASGTVDDRIEFNNDTDTNYSNRRSDNGAADVIGVNKTVIAPNASITTSAFTNLFIINNSANEKLVIYNSIEQNTSGSGTAPIRVEGVGKWDSIVSQISRIDIENSAGGSYDTPSRMKVWGAN